MKLAPISGALILGLVTLAIYASLSSGVSLAFLFTDIPTIVWIIAILIIIFIVTGGKKRK